MTRIQMLKSDHRLTGLKYCETCGNRLQIWEGGDLKKPTAFDIDEPWTEARPHACEAAA